MQHSLVVAGGPVLASSAALVSPSVAWWTGIGVLLVAGSAGLSRVRQRPARRPARRRRGR